MLPVAGVLLVVGVVLAEPASRLLAAARWPTRRPAAALLLWQVIGLVGGLAVLGSGVAAGLSGLGDTPPAVLVALLDGARPGVVGTVILLLTGLVAARLLGVLGLLTVRTLRARRRHRDLLDVLATPWPGVPGARVLDHPLPVAYCLPGMRRSRLVLSAGALAALDPTQLRAVLAHERAHLAERHDLVVLPFVAWGATAPFVGGMRRAQAAVAELVELRADDLARAQVGAAPLLAALDTVRAGLHGLTDTTPAHTQTVGRRRARLMVPL